jgi:transposase
LERQPPPFTWHKSAEEIPGRLAAATAAPATNSERSNLTGHAGARAGDPGGLDVEAYKGRKVAERSFALAKQWRALAARYDKLAITYRAAVILSACITWTRI